MTNPNWIYPEDTPSPTGRKRPRGPKIGRIALGLSIAAVVALWAGVALSDANRAAFASSEPTHDAHGRYILRGDPQARPSPHHSGGGPTDTAAEHFLSLRHLGPFRIEGDWFSSGTLVLGLVFGPEAVAGSCLGNVTMDIHAARGGIAATSANQDTGYAVALSPALRAHYHQARASGQIGVLREQALTAADLAGFGYPRCEEPQ